MRGSMMAALDRALLLDVPPVRQPQRRLPRSFGALRQSRRAFHDFHRRLCCEYQRRQVATTTQRALQISSFSLIAPLAVGLALSGCTTTGTSEAPSPSAGVSVGQRDLTPEEKQVIMDAVAPTLRNP